MSRQGTTRARLGIAGFVILLFGFIGAGVAHAAPPGYNVYVGYADTLRPNPASFPTPFDTAPGITREGDPSTSSLDSGGIRLVNTTGATETVNSVTVDVGSSHFDLWPHNTTLPSFNQLVFDQTNAYNFDTSDAIPALACTPDGIIPKVTVTVDGVATSYNDSGQVLNTGGVDKPFCNGSGINESAQWVSIGQPPCPTGAVLALSPQTQSHMVGDTATVNANFAACGNALQGATVDFSVISGPNAGKTGSGVVDASGNASFPYQGTGGPGTDTVKATVTNGAGTISSNTVTVTWQAGVTAVSGNAYGESINLKLFGFLPVKSGPTPSVKLPASGGGPFKASLLSLNLPNVLSLGIMDVSTRGSLGATGGSNSRASTADALVPNILSATAVTSSCKSSLSGSSGSASVVNLSIPGHPLINGKLSPNTTIPLPPIGKVILDEQTVTNTATTSSINVNAVHVVFSGLLGTGGIIISHSHCDVTK